MFPTNLKDLIKAEKRHQMLLGIVFILYVILNVRTPTAIAGLIDTVAGNIVVSLVALVLLFNSNLVVGVLGLVVAYFLIQRSSLSTGTFALKNYLPSEQSKVIDFSKYNDYPKTLEEEVVAKMAPLVEHAPAPNVDYHPILDGLHDAAPVDYDGVV